MSLEATLSSAAAFSPLTPAPMIPAPAHCALLLLEIESHSWKPATGRTSPPGELCGICAGIQARFARDYNSSQQSRIQNTMALLMVNGGVFMWRKIPNRCRPADPCGFPVNTEGPLMTGVQAQDIASARNSEIIKTARVPRVWWIALRDINSALLSPVS